ncbi:5-formyltetrahydrofolate cyclo-ligase [Legionella parisiensis]|uniref:5-formyltetrahydrofolate cyclo-ligase n=1 Tax=Legionella parisiensis TaxID=45071 RepID=A0A1E5JWA1_9GAMM|nr:5-formyltetrahydrofolate cyclo-ligase [Legionella parisiensis]KTD40049.1 5-formyltetrahydrofolate cyclo-ligase [Legionella parisiensis]OEH48804.1 5-formyltetrahydrofolate cyclo-ligase [Legionella parisiensis]STX77407.1 5-formyltetrahydrofolate cyclo-ligase [Legionella parisiensis]
MTDHAKKALRDTMKQIRSKISVSYRATASNQVCTRIRFLEQYRRANQIALYFAVNGEIDLDELWKHALLQGKLCYFPVLNEDLTLSFLPATSDTPFQKNRYGISEPDVSPDLAIPVEKLDLVLVPLVAFDVRCNRLGMGAGYYDRTFKGKENSPLFGVAYQFQRVDDYLEPEPWDIQLSAVITQRAIYWYGG